jgi:3-deoxy-7-phosphoheptulonate synthase
MNTTDRNLRAVHLPVDWRPSSWRERTALQLPAYPDADALATVLSELHGLPPLVTSWEILTLKQQLAEAQEGKRFLLQGGDCAENFTDCSSEVISNRLKVLLQMSLVLVHGLRLPVVRVGRFAGQYAKPRSADLETRDGVTLPSYRGDMVNAPEFTLEARTPEPRRMVKAHARSAMTMNFVRSLIDGGFADLHHPEYWDLGWVGHSPLADDYRRMVAGIGDAVRFMETLSGAEVHNLNRVDFYTSHEALLLPYEEAMTRQDSLTGQWYDTSAHMLWIGDRTRFPGSAHVEFLRGVGNPIGVKCGPSLEPDVLLGLLDTLNPAREAGRITLISRFGNDKVEAGLPRLVRAVQREGHPVVWSCDPMHGNVIKAESGYKTRPFDRILGEVKGFFAVHRAEGTHAGGIHVEMTGQDVTECTGGAVAITDEGLADRYHTHCDPRLNAAQSLELAFLLAEMLNLEMTERQKRAA